MFESKAKINLWVECGDDYYYGRDGETIDYEMASLFYFKAMMKKHPRASYMLGLCYELGQGVDTDREYAEILYEKAAGYGDENAKKRLASGKLPDETKNRAPEQPPKDLSPPTTPYPLSTTHHPLSTTHYQLEKLLKEKRKSSLTDNNDYDSLTLALLAIKARKGGAALFDSKTVRAYLTDLLPNNREMRRLSALAFDAGAIALLRSEPQKAIRKLKARGLSGLEAGRLMDCFAAAFAVTVNYEGLPDDALVAAAEYDDAEAVSVLALRRGKDGGKGPFRAYPRKAAEAGRGPGQGLLESPSLFEREDEDGEEDE